MNWRPLLSKVMFWTCGDFIVCTNVNTPYRRYKYRDDVTYVMIICPILVHLYPYIDTVPLPVFATISTCFSTLHALWRCIWYIDANFNHNRQWSLSPTFTGCQDYRHNLILWVSCILHFVCVCVHMGREVIQVHILYLHVHILMYLNVHLYMHLRAFALPELIFTV